MNICPTEAVKMVADPNGYMFPHIQNELCIGCGVCKEVCAFQKETTISGEPFATYVAINKSQRVLESSASGGVFAALASLVFESDGVVFGCAYGVDMKPEHFCVDNPEDMKKLQGSKYVQSYISTAYADAKEYLDKGRWVLFTGTPCQIAALKSYLGKDSPKLITADLVCHGVPNAAFFRDYIRCLESRWQGCRVLDFKFRDKAKGWGLMGKVVYEQKGRVFHRLIHPFASSYYHYFLKGHTYRESCYECRYANGGRPGDFSMGDYWGVQESHPDVETKKGVSVLLVNTEKGMALIDKLSQVLHLTESTFNDAKAHNSQLGRPPVMTPQRAEILRTYREAGYRAVDDEYRRRNRSRVILFRLKTTMPKWANELLRNVRKRKGK